MLRVYLAGGLRLEADGRLLREADFPSRQVRNAFAYLALERHRAVERDELVEALWPTGGLPASLDTSLSAVLSKLRAALGRVGLSRAECITGAFGCLQLRLPADAWVDVEEALARLHDAEGALLVGEPWRGYMAAVVASSILRRPLLPGLDAPWADRQRSSLHAARLRALDALIGCLEWNGEIALALKNAEEAVQLEPLREQGYRHLMRLHSQAGNRAEALAAYHRCQTVLAEEVGVDPSGETEQLFQRVVGAG